jgi:hypothetical protein
LCKCALGSLTLNDSYLLIACQGYHPHLNHCTGWDGQILRDDIPPFFPRQGYIRSRLLARNQIQPQRYCAGPNDASDRESRPACFGNFN